MSPMQSPRTSLTGAVGSSEPAWLARHPMRLLSAYNELLGGEPPYTSCHGRFIGTVDFMWFSPEVPLLSSAIPRPTPSPCRLS